jgi:transposase
LILALDAAFGEARVISPTRSFAVAAISLDLRRRVLADCQAGHTFAAVARKYTVSAEWVRVFFRRFEPTGEIAARSHATRRQPFHVRHEAALRTAVTAVPDRTLAGLRAHLGLTVSIPTLWAALHALKISFKKSRSGPPNRTARTSPPGGSRGGRGKPASTRPASSFSTRRG